MAAASVLDRMNLPDGFGYLLLVLALILTLAPWFHGQDFGLLKIPDFAPRTRRALLFVGPLALLLAVGLHAPLPSVVPRERGASQPASSAATPLPPADGRVLAEWRDTGCLFPARLVERGGGMATLLFDFGEEADVAVGEVFVATKPEIEIGASGYAKLANREAWLPVTIRDTRARNVQVRAGNTSCAAEFEKPLKWVPIDDLIAASPIGEAR